MARRLVIDLDICAACRECTARCGYFYRAQATDTGVLGLRERAAFHVTCRRCAAPSCVAACTFGALERTAEGILVRHALRCVACGLCVQACPFGTIRADTVAFYATPCDNCEQLNAVPPHCVDGCPNGAIAFREASDTEPGLHVVDVHLAARATAWKREEAS